MTKLKAMIDEKVSIVLSVILLLISFLIVMTLAIDAWDGSVASSFASGSGTEASPYIISNENQLAYFNSRLASGVTFEGKYFELTNDLDMTGAAWTSTSTVFDGVFNGNGHTVILNNTFINEIGSGGTINFLNVVANTQIAGRSILCESNYGIIENCLIRGSVRGSSDHLGLVCSNNYGVIRNVGAVGEITGPNTYAAGITYSNSGEINNVYTSINISVYASGKYGSSNKKAIAYSNSGTITNAYVNSSFGTDSNSTAASVDTLKSQDFVDQLNQNTTKNASWVPDSNNFNDGFPILTKDVKLDVICRLEISEDSLYINNGSSLRTRIITTQSDSVDIYYTIDGTDPRSSNTSIKYNGAYITLNGDVVIKMVAFDGNIYSTITTQKIVSVSGLGTEANPYLIADKYDLVIMPLYGDAHYKLTADIVLTEEDFSPSGIFSAGWISIPEFTGVIDGQGHKIENLQGSSGGLVTQNSGTIKNLRLINATMTNNGSRFGAIADYNGGTITKCYVSLYTVLNGCTYAGGLVGDNYGTISYCTIEGSLHIKGPSYSYCWIYYGGIASGGGTINSCYSNIKLSVVSPSVTEYLFIGGISANGYAVNCRSDSELIASVALDYDIYSGAFTSHFSTGGDYMCFGEYTYSYSNYPGTSNLRVGHRSPNYTSYVVKETGAAKYLLESSLPTLDFDMNWMITPNGPMPQGVMNADGNCYTKISYIAPTCSTIGYTKCLNQYGETITLEIPATGIHQTASTENKILPDCVKPGIIENIVYCIHCNIEISRDSSEVDALGHAWRNATCTFPQTCERCGATNGAPLGHNEVYQAAKAATCTTIGWQAYVTCSRCDYTTYVEIPATGHQPSDWIVDAAATYEKDGTKHKECTVCRVIIETSIVPMLKHSYVSTVTAPTCTEQGYTTHICTDCGNKYIDDYVYATGHYYGEWIQTIAPGNETTGQERRDCTVCDHYELQDIAPLGYSQVFIDAVMALPKYRSAEATYSELYSALQIYAKLTVEEKSEVNEYFLLLQELIESYNANATVANTEAEKATEVAFAPIAMNFVFLAALWALLKKLLVK